MPALTIVTVATALSILMKTVETGASIIERAMAEGRIALTPEEIIEFKAKQTEAEEGFAAELARREALGH